MRRFFSQIVNRSASAWQGCSLSDRPLMTGTPAYWARVSTSLVGEYAGHDAVHHAPQHARHVGHAFALAQRDVVGAEV